MVHDDGGGLVGVAPPLHIHLDALRQLLPVRLLVAHRPARGPPPLSSSSLSHAAQRLGKGVKQ